MFVHVECVSVEESLVDIARQLRDLDGGAMPICGEGHRLKGMLTDRDITVRCVADGTYPNSVKVAEFANGKPPTTIGVDDSIEEPEAPSNS